MLRNDLRLLTSPTTTLITHLANFCLHHPTTPNPLLPLITTQTLQPLLLGKYPLENISFLRTGKRFDVIRFSVPTACLAQQSAAQSNATLYYFANQSNLLVHQQFVNLTKVIASATSGVLFSISLFPKQTNHFYFSVNSFPKSFIYICIYILIIYYIIYILYNLIIYYIYLSGTLQFFV